MKNKYEKHRQRFENGTDAEHLSFKGVIAESNERLMGTKEVKADDTREEHAHPEGN